MAYLTGSDKPTILAWFGSANGSFKIGFKITSFDLGGYNFWPTEGYNPPPPRDYSNLLYYYDDNGMELPVINGAVNILSNVNGRISGNFTANVVDANNQGAHVAGSFTDVPVKP